MGPKLIFGLYEAIFIPRIEIGIKLSQDWYYLKVLPKLVLVVGWYRFKVDEFSKVIGSLLPILYPLLIPNSSLYITYQHWFTHTWETLFYSNVGLISTSDHTNLVPIFGGFFSVGHVFLKIYINKVGTFAKKIERIVQV